jgi:hypothetical protein
LQAPGRSRCVAGSPSRALCSDPCA